MVYIFYTNLALEFLAVIASTALLVWAFNHRKGDGAALATFIGTFILIFAFLTMICTLVSGGKGWMAGQFAVPETPAKVEQLQKLNQMEQMIEQMKGDLKTQKEERPSK